MPIPDESMRTLKRLRQDMIARHEAEKASKRTHARRARRKRALARAGTQGVLTAAK